MDSKTLNAETLNVATLNASILNAETSNAKTLNKKNFKCKNFKWRIAKLCRALFAWRPGWNFCHRCGSFPFHFQSKFNSIWLKSNSIQIEWNWKSISVSFQFVVQGGLYLIITVLDNNCIIISYYNNCILMPRVSRLRVWRPCRRNSVWCQINRKSVITIKNWSRLIR